MARAAVMAGLVLVALAAAACGTAIEVTSSDPSPTPPPAATASSAEPSSTGQPEPTARPGPTRQAVAPDLDDTLGTSSADRYPIEVGGRLTSLLSYDEIRPVYDPEFVEGDRAFALDAGDLVIGLSLNGDSRAYPVRTLRNREMVNDEVGGIPVLVTW